MSDTPVKLPFDVSLRSLAMLVSGLLVLGGVAEIASTTSCAAAATNNPLRSFEDARNVDVVCMSTLTGEDGGGVLPTPLPQAACTPVPAGVTGSILPNHLFALVTQVKRGEVAVVDLTAGNVIDEDLGTPGINFLPVGQIPTGIASAPDGKMSYVVAAEVNKPAIYALPSKLILGNSQQLEASVSPTPPLLTTWPVCALPQTPTAITIIPNAPGEPAVDAGAGGSADAGGAAPPQNPAGYVLAVVLAAGGEGQPARVVTYDPMPLLRGGGLVPTDDGPVDPPGQLKPCKWLGEVVLANQVPDAGVGPAWQDGVKWLEAGVEASTPSTVACTTAGGFDAGTLPPPLPNPAAQPSAAARAGQYLYVADGALPIIHVFDLTNPDAPREVEPLRATSLAQPTRGVTVSTIAISPPTRYYQRFLYAVDATDSPPSIIVFDISDPVASPHVPLRRPHSALVPLQPQDRIAFASGVAALAFVQHDWPVGQTPNGALIPGAAYTGLLCNPNQNVDLGAADASADAQSFSDPGANYRYSSLAFADEPLGPTRLRGIFAFATLSSGQVMTIDVDDWDAPCRRPSIMGPQDAGEAGVTSGFTSAIAPPEPYIDNHDGGPLDPYEAPYTYSTNGVPWVTDEVFFPVSEPHRPRSNYPLSNDPTLGLHYPYIATPPQLYGPGPDGGLGAAISGSLAVGNPTLNPTATIYPDPANLPDGGSAVRIAYEDPLAHIDQAWSIDYEGRLTSFGGIEGNLNAAGGIGQTEGLASSAPPYWTLFIPSTVGSFCARGVEDWTVGKQRAAAFEAASKAAGLPWPEDLAAWLGDYVQVQDDLLPPTDPYWTSDPTANQTNDCWAGFNGTLDGGVESPPLTDPTLRYNTCMDIFGLSGDESIARDFPIIEAYDDGLVITRFNYPGTTALPVTASTSNREITPADPTNVPALKQLACCFHNQMTFNVRTGGEWVTTGTASGYLHHITRDNTTNRCVNSCDPQQALLNGRAIGIAASPTPVPVPVDGGFSPAPPGRDSPLAMRNPFFAFYIQHPWISDPNVSLQAMPDGGAIPQVIGRPTRDDVWTFALKGELSPLSVNLAATNSSVSPQSMLFIPSLGQLAIVDGSQEGQGLILIDLNAVAVTGNSYY